MFHFKGIKMARQFLGVHDVRRENTKDLLRKSGLLRAEFTEKSDISYALLGHYIGKNPIKSIGDETAEKIEKFFNKPKNWLDHEYYPNDIDVEDSISANKIKLIPVLNSVQAGNFTNISDMSYDEYLPVFEAENFSDEIYWLKFKGNSMTPDDGEVVMWNIHGVISPITDDVSIDRSPYEISMLDFVKKFSFSNERVAILRGFLYYRKLLYSLGITAGFQWVNGSFVENVETLRGRPPNDIDVVSFIAEPENPLPDELFDNSYIKQQYQVDSYFVDLNGNPQELVKLTAYWYSMWSHQRETQTWKGFFHIPLSIQDDIVALNYLEGL